MNLPPQRNGRKTGVPDSASGEYDRSFFYSTVGRGNLAVIAS